MSAGWDDLIEEHINSDVIRLRRVLGMGEISFQEVQCRRIIEYSDIRAERCKRMMKAQFIDGVQQNHYCHNCRYSISRMESASFTIVK